MERNIDIAALLSEFKNQLIALYGPRLAGVYLYGSYARGEQDSESDVDVLVVLDQVPQLGSEFGHVNYAASELSFKYGVTVSVVLSSRERWEKAASAFLKNVREEAVAA